MGTIPFDDQRGPPVTFPLVTQLLPGHQYSCITLANINDFVTLSGHLKDYVEHLLDKYEEQLKMYGKKIEKFSIGKTYAILTKQNLSTFGGAYSDNYKTQGIYRKFNNSYKKKRLGLPDSYRYPYN